MIGITAIDYSTILVQNARVMNLIHGLCRTKDHQEDVLAQSINQFYIRVPSCSLARLIK